MNFCNLKSSEAVVRRCSVKKVFLEISQNSQENTCTRVFWIRFLILKNTNFQKILRCNSRSPPPSSNVDENLIYPVQPKDQVQGLNQYFNID